MTFISRWEGIRLNQSCLDSFKDFDLLVHPHQTQEGESVTGWFLFRFLEPSSRLRERELFRVCSFSQTYTF